MSEGLLILAVISYLFYGNFLWSILFSPLLFYYLKYKKELLAKEQRWQLNLEFKDALQGILAALNAGYSIENSFQEAKRDLMLIYSENAGIMKELSHITSQLKKNHITEELLYDLAVRSQVEDIMDFATVFITAKRTGGNLLKIINRTTKNINDKIEMKRQIQTMISGKKMEARLMNIVPIGILAYLKLFSQGFMEVLYINITGRLIMTMALAAYIGSVYMTEKIINIEV